jgi:hypothetical protein
MLITFLRSRLVGTRCYRRGDSVHLPDARANRLISAGIAASGGRPVTFDTPPADLSPPSNAAGPADDPAETTLPEPTFEEIGITPKAAKYLRDGGLATLDDVESRTDQELIDLPGLGKASVSAIRAALTAHRGSEKSEG